MAELETGGSDALAIAMWDFSWLERRWRGAGYEDWATALDGLSDRGYDVVRIDAYPHLVGHDPEAEYTLVPLWPLLWGSPHTITVRPYPALIEFIGLAHERGMKVALSSWFREDLGDVRMRIDSPQRLAEVWCRTLARVDEAGLLDAVWFVDLCNEWPQAGWAPFMYGPGWQARKDLRRTDREAERWTNVALAGVREAFPDVPLCFSVCNQFENVLDEGIDHYDLLEPHIWMTSGTPRDYYKELEARFLPEGGDGPLFFNMDVHAEGAEKLYRESQEVWRAQLVELIKKMADWSRKASLPLVTTECWGVVTWQDGPGLDWGWVKELCEFGVTEAVKQGQWKGIATSNFCGPQFHGMWDDIAWHRRLTDLIHGGASGIAPSISGSVNG